MGDLDYENAFERPTHSNGCAAMVIGTFLCTFLHFIGCSWASYQFFKFASGTRSSSTWTIYGGIDYSWTNLAWLPGGLLFVAGGNSADIHSAQLEVAALAVLFLGSALAAYLMMIAIYAVLKRRYGTLYWKLWSFVPFWLVWLPVPVKMTLTYWHTVAY